MTGPVFNGMVEELAVVVGFSDHISCVVKLEGYGITPFIHRDTMMFQYILIPERRRPANVTLRIVVAQIVGVADKAVVPQDFFHIGLYQLGLVHHRHWLGLAFQFLTPGVHLCPSLVQCFFLL